MKITYSRNVREGYYAGRAQAVSRPGHRRVKSAKAALRHFPAYVPWVVDKSKWQEGQWNNEADNAYWRYKGLSCVILRTRHSGALCGYVGVPFGHPLFGMPAWGSPFNPEVHWGVNWAQFGWRQAGFDPRLWYFGFDCAHLHDLRPRDAGTDLEEFDSTYRTMEYVMAECNHLACQIAAFGKEQE